MTNRKEFEAWATRQRSENGLPYFIVKLPDGEYVDRYTKHAWHAWQAACPDGWQCVPKDPVEGQIEAGCKATGECESLGECHSDCDCSPAPKVYRAMLSAAPKPGEEIGYD